MNEAVSLKEHMEKIIDIRWTETERRLDNLNKLRDEVVQDRSQFVKLEVFDIATKEASSRFEAFQKEDTSYRDRTNNRLTTIETRLVTYSAAIGFFFLAIQVALKVIPLFK